MVDFMKEIRYLQNFSSQNDYFSSRRHPYDCSIVLLSGNSEMGEPNIAYMHVQFPADLVRRAKRVSKIFRCRMAQMVRDGLAVKVNELEDRHEQEKARDLAQREGFRNERAQHGLRDVRRLGDPSSFTRAPFAASSPAPMRAPVSIDTPSTTATGYLDDMDSTYERLARDLLNAGENPEEIKRRAVSAVEAVKRERPLTHPSEAEILTKLEQNLLRVRGQMPKAPERTYDDLVGKIVDVGKVKTLGDTEE